MRFLAAVASMLVGASVTPSSAQIVSGFTLGPLTKLSGLSPFGPLEACGDFALGSDTNYVNAEVEPHLAISPTDPSNVVAIMQQGRWADSDGARAMIAAVTKDGGRSFETVVVPGLSACSGGVFPRTVDPWVAFGGDGVLYQVSISHLPWRARAVALVSKSIDGGLQWGPPVPALASQLPRALRKPTIFAHPALPGHVYVHIPVYNAAANPESERFTTSAFLRSTDRGATWTPSTGVADNAVFSEMLVAPNGVMFHFFAYSIEGIPTAFLGQQVSTDNGASWLPENRARIIGQVHRTDVRTPDAFELVETSGSTVAIDKETGVLYVIWPDFRSNDVGANDVLLMQSLNLGQTWSVPIKVNLTPPNANPLRQQSFLSTVAAKNGTVVVTYYDFRNDDDTGEWADFFASACASDCANASSWVSEVRLTDESFDMSKAVLKERRTRFLGDYVGTVTDGLNYYAVFPITTADPEDPSDVYIRKFTPVLAPSLD